MPTADPELLARARRLISDDAEVGACWALVLRGIELGWIDHDELGEVISYLRDERDYGVEELLFANSFTANGTRLRVSFLSETATCDPSLMIEALLTIAA